jgi:hypothetical protein
MAVANFVGAGGILSAKQTGAYTVLYAVYPYIIHNKRFTLYLQKWCKTLRRYSSYCFVHTEDSKVTGAVVVYVPEVPLVESVS